MKLKKNMIKSLLLQCFNKSGLLSFFKKIALENTVTILTYHRILEHNSEYIEPGMYVSRDMFDMQMQTLRNQYSVIKLSTLARALGGHDILPQPNKPYCIITFDDGWRDNYENAFPVLKKYSIPATIFLTTDYIGSNKWFWPDEIKYLIMHNQGKLIAQVTGISFSKNLEKFSDIVIKELKERYYTEIEKVMEKVKQQCIISIDTNSRRMVNESEIKEMSEYGIEFGSHSHTHRILDKLSRKEINFELTKSKEILENKGINFVPIFCYPNGNYNQDIINCVKESGYNAAVTTKRGHIDLRNIKQLDLFTLPRIGIHNDISYTESLFQWRIFRF